MPDCAGDERVASLFAHDYVTEHSAKIKFVAETTFSFSALIVIIAQVVIYGQQRDAMRQQVANAVISERAYIGLEDLTLIGPLTAGVPPRIRAIFRNGGRTPAWSFASYARMAISTKSIAEVLQEYPVEASKSEGVSFLPAGIQRRAEFPTDFVVTPERIVAINGKFTRLFVYGEVHFKDFANRNRVFLFRTVYNPDQGSFEDAD